MIRAALLTWASLVGLTGCAAADAAPPRSAEFRPANRIGDPPRATAAAALAGRLPARSAISTLAPKPVRKHGSPLARVGAANRAATREPASGVYVNATQVYPWSEGALYRLYTAPGEVSDVALEPGETLVSVAAGDTARWIIGDTVSGAGAGRRTHILVKPSSSGLKTNLVIATNRRVYHVEVESNDETAMQSIAWTYPHDDLVALESASAATAAQTAAADIAVEALDFDYAIEGDNPPWRPIRAFDDGRQVFIQFPPTVGAAEAPPLFVRGEDGRTELVNYRVRGRYYVVDRLFAVAELRLGERHQQVVRIVRVHPAARERRGS